MAITYYTGIPRSGKSLKAVAFIYHTFVSLPIYFRLSFGKKNKFPKDNENLLKLYDFKIFKIYKLQKKIPYENCYTNINQFDFSISDKILKFDFDEIYLKLTILHALYMDKKTDDELIEKSKELNIFKSLFVLDEAHNFLKKKDDPVLVWWFTYHGHLYQDIILITQDLKLVNDEYKRTAEYFFKAVPQRLRLSKNVFKYRQFSSYQMYQRDLISTDSLKVIPEYYSLYVSGDSPKSKSIIHKYLYILLFFLLLFPFVLYRFYNNLNSNEAPQPLENPTNKEIIQNENIPQTLQNQFQNDSLSSENDTPVIPQTENLKLFKFNCFDFFCYYKIDKKTSLEIPTNILKAYLLDISEDKKFTQIKNNRLMIYLLVDEQKLNFLQGVQDETTQENNNNFIPNLGNN